MIQTRAVLALFIALAFLGSRTAGASSEIALQISQPIMTLDSGCMVSDVTFTGYWSLWDSPQLEVDLTVAPSAVTTEQETVDRNGAAALGLHVEFPKGDENPISSRNGVHDHFLGLFGDTLRVVLDLTAMKVESELWRGFEAEIVGATVECLKLNARRGWPRIRTLDLQVRGPSQFQSHTGIYPLESVSCAQRPVQVTAPKVGP